jgi:hypothetical protein
MSGACAVTSSLTGSLYRPAITANRWLIATNLPRIHWFATVRRAENRHALRLG